MRSGGQAEIHQMAHVVLSGGDLRFGRSHIAVLDFPGDAVAEPLLGRVAHGYAEDLDGKTLFPDIRPLKGAA